MFLRKNSKIISVFVSLLLSTSCSLQNNDKFYIPESVVRKEVNFSELTFYLPDIEEAKGLLKKFRDNMNESDSLEEQIALIKEYDYEIRGYSEMASIANIRFSSNINNETKADIEYFNDFFIGISQDNYEATKAIIESKYIKGLEKYFGKEIIDLYREAARRFDIVATKIDSEISVLENEYIQLVAEHSSQAGIIFKKEADAILSKMLTLRESLAEVYGYENYIEFAYSHRFFSVSDNQMYIENIKQTVLPVYKKLIDKFPNSIEFSPASKLIKPVIITTDNDSLNEIYKLSIKTLGLSLEEINPVVDYIERNEMMDIMPRKNKNGATNYTLFLGKSQIPFIYLRTVDSNAIIHEFGHALEFFEWPKIDVVARFSATPESSEIASIGMEVIASTKYEMLYGNTAEYARMRQIYNLALEVLKAAMISEFELAVYENPEMKMDERESLFQSLLKEYQVGRDIRTWQGVYHFFRLPLYYISYSIDSVVAFELLRIQKDDPQRAKEMYLNYIQNPTEKNFIRRLKTAGFSSPFEKQNLEDLAVFLDSIFTSDEYLHPE